LKRCLNNLDDEKKDCEKSIIAEKKSCDKLEDEATRLHKKEVRKLTEEGKEIGVLL
jgi:hypothetical protein